MKRRGQIRRRMVRRKRGDGQGNQCPVRGCEGHIHVYHTHIEQTETYRIRYLRCDKCGHKPEGNKVIVPLRYAPPRG